MGIMELVFILVSVGPWLLFFGAAVYLIHEWKKPGPAQLHRAEVDELREQVSLMRDFLRDAMDRIRRLEEAQQPAVPGRRSGRGPVDSLPGRGDAEDRPPLPEDTSGRGEPTGS